MLGFFIVVGALFMSIDCRAHVVDHVTTSQLIPRAVLFGNPEKTAVTISPDGTKLAYCAPYNNVLNIWVKIIEKDDAAPVTYSTGHGITRYCWAHDNRHMIYSQDNNGDEQDHVYRINLETKAIQDLTPFADVKVEILSLSKYVPHELLVLINKDDPKLFDVYRINLIDGTCVVDTKNPGAVGGWMADKDLVVRAAIRLNADETQTLLVRDNNDDAWRSLLTVDFKDSLCEELHSDLIGFSADGTSLYLNSSIDSDTKRLICMNIITGSYEEIARDATYDIEGVVFDTDTHVPEIAFWQKDRLTHNCLQQTTQKDLACITSHVSDGVLESVSRSDDKTMWVVGFACDVKSYQYYLYDRIAQTMQHLFSVRPTIDTYVLSPMKPISYVTRDGLTIHGYLTGPSNIPAKKVPLVLFVHGGPMGRDVWGLQAITQFIANRGIACLQVNYRGSTGYGKKFMAAGDGEWAAKMHDDLIDAVEWAVNEGIADPEKVGIFGGSYGGYAALVGVTFTPDVFCCAVDYVGPTNLITLLKSIPAHWSLAQWEQRIGKLSDEEFLKSRSPLYKVDNIKKPILIAHGAHDVRVKQAEADQIVEAMKQKGIPHEYLLFADEGHGFARPENRMKFFAAVEAFFAKHLGSQCEHVD